MGSVAANGGQGFVYLHTRGFYSPSFIENNDFSQGFDGWEIDTAPVWLIPHEEESLLQSSLAINEMYSVDNLDTNVDRSEIHNLLNQELSTVSQSQQTNFYSLTEQDIDLVLSTSGEGPQTISRTFNISQGTKNVTVRYRFITTEIPGGYFGTKYNDYFNITIRSDSGTNITKSNSMNGSWCI